MPCGRGRNNVGSTCHSGQTPYLRTYADSHGNNDLLSRRVLAYPKSPAVRTASAALAHRHQDARESGESPLKGWHSWSF